MSCNASGLSAYAFVRSQGTGVGHPPIAAWVWLPASGLCILCMACPQARLLSCWRHTAQYPGALSHVQAPNGIGPHTLVFTTLSSLLRRLLVPRGVTTAPYYVV
jgi:hypothetical protein